MKLFVITTEQIFPDEAFVLNDLFLEGMPVLHLRKPAATAADLENLLDRVRPEFLDRIVLHDHFELLSSYPLRGVHLNSRHPKCPAFAVASVSRSCHSIPEVESSLETCKYVFLSPIFDSISKNGYRRAFSHEELLLLKSQGVINEKVIALGGIEETLIPLVAHYGFGGVAVLGSLWGSFPSDKDREFLIKRFLNLKSVTDKL
jgi:thiamine-phosphate pyrophosphorylase